MRRLTSWMSLLLSMLVCFQASAQEQASIALPFRIALDPMERLLLINFERDPDTLYVGFEPQVFDDTVNGRGHLIVAWRRDGQVDVYHQPTLRPDPSKYDIAGKGLARMIVTEMHEAYFEVNDRGVQARYAFEDAAQRPVRISIRESCRRRRKPFALLAPMGDAAASPSALPLVWLDQFYFVRRKGAEVRVQIGARSHRIDRMPMPISGTRMYFMRYSTLPLIATLNPAYEGPLLVQSVASGASYGEGEGHEYGLDWRNGQPAIARITRVAGQQTLGLRFEPPFPDPRYLHPGDRYGGRFELEAMQGGGVVMGLYTVERGSDDTVRMLMHPSGGWKPQPDRPSLRFLYAAGKVFRDWPTRYRWHAELVFQGEEQPFLRSYWERLKP